MYVCMYVCMYAGDMDVQASYVLCALQVGRGACHQLPPPQPYCLADPGYLHRHGHGGNLLVCPARCPQGVTAAGERRQCCMFCKNVLIWGPGQQTWLVSEASERLSRVCGRGPIGDDNMSHVAVRYARGLSAKFASFSQTVWQRSVKL